jgi:ABC-type glutathione transport system ATPase component
MVVEEASVRHHYPNFISVPANHIDVCKPKSEMDTRFQHSVRCIREVVDDVNENHGNTLDIKGHVVGIKHKLQEVWKRMEVHSIVGLVRMGGIGKTTLSKKLYNCEEKKKQFEKFCFLEDVKSHGSEASRKQLHCDLCGKN